MHSHVRGFPIPTSLAPGWRHSRALADFFSPVNLVYRTSEASSFRILGRFPSTPSFHVLADVSDYPSILTAWRGSKYFYDLGIGNIPAS